MEQAACRLGAVVNNPSDRRSFRRSNAVGRPPPRGPVGYRPKGRDGCGPYGRVRTRAHSPHNQVMSASPDAPAIVDLDGLQAELSQIRDDKMRAECMAAIQRDAVQLTLDLLVAHPDLRGFFRMFIKRLVDEVDARACGVWLLDETTNGCDLWMANIGGETL